MSTIGNQLVYTVKEYGKSDANKVVFFFCPLAISARQLSGPGMPIWRLTRAGYRVIAYDYPPSISSTSAQHTLANIEAILADANGRMAKIPAEVAVSCFGTSMGTVLAVNFAVQHDRIQKVILNLAYADISDHILHLPNLPTVPAKRLRTYLETVGGEQGLRAAFDPYSPLSLVNRLEHKKLLVYSSKNDPILKPVHTKAMHDALTENHIDAEFYQNRGGGHLPALYINFWRYKRWLRFLESDTKLDSTFHPKRPFV